MFFSKERRENEEDGKRSSGNKNMSHHKNKKYVRNLKQSLYNNKYINKFQKRNKDLKTKRGGNVNYVYNNVSTDVNNNNKHSQLYFSKNLINRNNKETQNRTNVYKKNYFNHDNINYNSLINSQTPICFIHIDKTDEEIKKQLQYNDQLNSLQNNNTNNDIINDIQNNIYPTFIEEIIFTTNVVLFTGILILSNNDKIFHNLDFEGKTNPLPIECNLNIYINVVNKYNSQHFKQLFPVSYNFKSRLFYAIPDNNNSTVDSTLLIDKIIIKGNFKTLSFIVLGQSEEINEHLRYHRENIYDINMKTKINETTVDVENIEAEKDDVYSPKKPVYIKTYNIANIMEENYDFEKKNSINDHKNYENNQIDELNELSAFSNILEKEFVKNNLHNLRNINKNYHKNNNCNNVDDDAKLNEDKKGEEFGQSENMSDKHDMNKSGKHDMNKSLESDLSDSSIETDDDNNNNNFIPPNNELIIKILNCLTNLYKKKKEINKNDLPIYKKIIKFGVMWLFYIYKNIKTDEDNFLFNYSKYAEIKIYDILGCLLVLRRCALYPNLAKYIIHMQINSNLIQIDRTCPYILIYLIDILSIDGVYFLSSWKIKTSILKTIIALISNYYVMDLFCNYVS
ncbi:synthetic antigen of P.falciparum, putative [Plasmodium yoelii yoelii]|nr:synthetic antigen of P.falciparum, putative [Plasmodium yoelii yoelii]